MTNICEHNFEREDEDNPGYSHHEVDYYAWIPQNRGHVVPNHRLSLRRNLVTKEWELYRAYHRGTSIQQIKADRELGQVIDTMTTLLEGLPNKDLNDKTADNLRQLGVLLISHTPSGIEEVAFKSMDFEEALDYGNDEWNRMHKTDDYDRVPDRPCTHGDTGTTATFCAMVERSRKE